jgi:murein DD-endopeptidase MepM/ murein hydrolase activator NlpD
VRSRGYLAFAALVVVLAALGVLAPVSAQQTPGLAEARERAAAATQRYDEAQAALGELDVELAQLEARATQTRAGMDELRDEVQAIAIERFTSSGEVPLLLEEDLNRHARAEALTRVVVQRDADALDRYEALREDLAVTTAELEQRRAEQEELLVELEEARAEIYVQLEALEEVERERLEEERRRLEEERRRIEEEQRRAAEAAAATSTTAAPAPGPGPTTTAAPAPPPGPPPPPPSPGSFVCPVQGPVFFTDTYGAPRPGGRWHQGVDMMASRGTPVVASVSGDVRHHNSSLGGLSYYLDGDDGRQYFGTHLDSYGASGRVPAGTIIGYVGSTGNAPDSAPHLHFEIKVNGSNINPTPTVAAAC